jgi:SAM-dependent methyltransferase
MRSQVPEHFPQQYLDDIRGNPENNYFTPVIKETLECVDVLQNICDVGCGNGVFSAAIKQWVECRLVGVDGSSYALQQAEARGFDELYQIDDFSSSRLPFGDAEFDLVLNKDVLEHLLYPEFLVSEIHRTVRKGGYALIHVPNHFPLAGRIRFLFNNNIDPFGFFPDARRWNYPHIRFFTMTDLCELFRQNGFEMVKDMSFHFFRAGLLNRLLPRYVQKSLCNNNPDAWVEGYTVLFRKTGE